MLGNHIRMWSNVNDLLTSGFNGKVTMRYKGSIGGSGAVLYEVPVTEVENRIAEWNMRGLDTKKIMFNEDCPDHKLVIQGEFLNSGFCDYQLFYSTLPTKMRIALNEDGKSVYGLKTRLILKYYMDPSSLDDIYLLSEIYSGHVIEFSTYSINVGNIPYRNTLIWEVRAY